MFCNNRRKLDAWLIQIGEPIPIRPGIRKQRLSLLCEALVKKGHNVIRWGSTFDHITKKMIFKTSNELKLAPNYTVKFIKGLGYSKNISIRRWIDHLMIEEKIISKASKMKKPDIILVATPPHSLAYKIVKYANKRNIPVIVDVRDQWPDIFVDRLPKKIRPFGRILLSYEFYKLEKALINADSVTAMMEDLLIWGIERSERGVRTTDKVFHIGTHIAEKPESKSIKEELKSLFAEFSGKTVFTFVGTFNNFYNPSIIVEVAKRFEHEWREDIIFVLAGSGDYFNEVKSKAINVKNIKITGWLQHEEIMALLSHSDVGICPLNEYRPCFPNKIFIYLSAFLPIISSTPGEFEKIIKEHNIGIYYHPGDSEGLYRAVLALANQTTRREFKMNVIKVFDDFFNAENIYSKFVEHIELISNNQV